MKTSFYVYLGIAAVAAYLLWKKSQQNKPLKLDDIGDTSEFVGGGGGGGLRRTAVTVRSRGNATAPKRRK